MSDPQIKTAVISYWWDSDNIRYIMVRQEATAINFKTPPKSVTMTNRIGNSGSFSLGGESDNGIYYSSHCRSLAIYFVTESQILTEFRRFQTEMLRPYNLTFFDKNLKALYEKEYK